jgi:hypothetical protein
MDAMAPLRPVNFRLESELMEAQQKIRERDGISVTEQVRRSIHAWIDAKGVSVKTERKRRAGRKRS